MNVTICGPGHFGRAIAALAESRGDQATLLARPEGGRHAPERFAAADVVIDASRADAVAATVGAATAGGATRLVIATTGWQASQALVERTLLDAGAAAVVAPNLSIGAALFLRLAADAAARFGALPAFDAFVWEWHRRGKADQPSGTALDLVRRMTTASPRLAGVEVVALRAGATPGVHVVGFDAPGETVELRHTARDRSGHAAGALAAADWLLREPRRPGIHAFDVVIDELLDPSPLAATA